MKPIFLLIAFLVLVALIVASSALYTVDMTEQVVITQFGDPVGRSINVEGGPNEAGLHFKVPFIQEVNRFERRILEWDSTEPSRNRTEIDMPTRDKLYIVMEAFARWRIADPLKYFRSLKDERSALSRLDDIIGSDIRNVVARHDLIEVIRTDKTRKPQIDETIATISPNMGLLPPIEFGRESLEKEVLDAAIPSVKLWGIELLDFRIKRVNYKEGVLAKIHDRMKSERSQIAERFRSEGMGEAAKILGKREKDLRQIESDAYKTVQEIMGKADAEATEIYAKAYNISPEAADFFQFVKTLDTYKTTLNRDSTLVITTDSDFFKYLKHISGEPAKTAPAKAAGAPPLLKLPGPAHPASTPPPPASPAPASSPAPVVPATDKP